MKAIWASSKYITYTYYGHPVDHVTLELSINEDVPESARSLLIEQAKRRLDSIPVERFPVAGAHVSLLDDYFKKHPEQVKTSEGE